MPECGVSESELGQGRGKNGGYKRIICSLPKDEHAAAKIAAKGYGLTLTAYVRYLLRRGVFRRHEAEKALVLAKAQNSAVCVALGAVENAPDEMVRLLDKKVQTIFLGELEKLGYHKIHGGFDVDVTG